MNTIISKLYTLIHQTDNLIDFEESVRILMYDLEGNAHYPFDEWIGFKKYQRRSPFVEVKVA
ncbi:MAG TPA: hypothetical protein VK057_12580 [Bacillota bacterium]|nr:hypothetical protein [Bacillota bacterium]